MNSSWDFWDTLVGRRLIKPTDIFSIIEQQMSLPGFAEQRIRAEKISRAGVKETNLERIYRFLDLPEDLKNSAMELELQLEYRLSFPILANTQCFRSEDIVISDMYLSKNEILKICNRCKIPVNPDNLYVSSEVGETKSSGDLYKHILNQRPIQNHIGDNKISDVRKPQKLGIRSSHFKDGAFTTSTEEYWHNLDFHGKIIAGAIRAGRLSYKHGYHKKRWEINTQIVAPLLIAFCEFIIESAIRKQINKLYFLSRDGQILKKISERIIEFKKLDIKCIYLYTSRQAIHIPGFTTLSEAKPWISAPPHPLTVDRVSKRLTINPNHFLLLMRDHLSANTTPESHIDQMSLERIINNKELEDHIGRKSQGRFNDAISYFSSIGLIQDWDSNTKIGYVDVGWHCRIQQSLDSICKKYGANPSNTIGFYLGIKSSPYKKNKRAIGFLFDDETRSRNLLNDFKHFDMFEIFLQADHSQVISYSSHGVQGIEFAPALSQRRKDMIREYHSAILSTTHHYLEQKKVLPEISILRSEGFIKPVFLLLSNPSISDVNAFAMDIHTGEQSGVLAEALVKKGKIRHLFNGQIPGFWPEANFALARLLWLFKLRKSFVHLIKRIARRFHR